MVAIAIGIVFSVLIENDTDRDIDLDVKRLVCHHFSASLIVKCSSSGEEVWRKKTELCKSLQICQESGNVALGEPLKILVLDPNGNLLNEYKPGNDSLLFVFPVNDTNMICVTYKDSVDLINRFLTSSESLVPLSSSTNSIYSGTFCLNCISGFKQKDGTVNVVVNRFVGGSGSSVVYHIKSQGTVEKTYLGTNGQFNDISRNGNFVVISTYTFPLQWSINVFNESFDDNKVIDLYKSPSPNGYTGVTGSVYGSVIQGDSNLLVLMQVGTQTYILGFPINGKPMLPPELYLK